MYIYCITCEFLYFFFFFIAAYLISFPQSLMWVFVFTKYENHCNVKKISFVELFIDRPSYIKIELNLKLFSTIFSSKSDPFLSRPQGKKNLIARISVLYNCKLRNLYLATLCRIFDANSKC